MKVTGRIVFRDVEGGVWTLKADDGKTYELSGADRGIKKDGHRVEAEGEIQHNSVSIGMSGTIFKVTSYRFL